MIRRLGSPETAREGIVLEMYGNKKCVLRGWHSGCVMIPAIHISVEELTRFMGLQPPPKRGRKPNLPLSRMEEGLPT